MEFKEKLFELRRANSLSQEELANKLNVSRQAVSKWEAGQSAPEMDKLPAIADVFGVTLDTLVRPCEIDVRATGAAMQEAQQRADAAKQRKKQNRSFLIVSVIVGFLLFTAITAFASSALVFGEGDIMLYSSISSLSLFGITALVIVLNYAHARRK